MKRSIKPISLSCIYLLVLSTYSMEKTQIIGSAREVTEAAAKDIHSAIRELFQSINSQSFLKNCLPEHVINALGLNELHITRLIQHQKLKALILFLDAAVWWKMSEHREELLQKTNSLKESYVLHRENSYQYAGPEDLIAKTIIGWIPPFKHLDSFKDPKIIFSKSLDEHSLDFFVLLIYTSYEFESRNSLIYQSKKIKIRERLTYFIQTIWNENIDIANVLFIAQQWNLTTIVNAILCALDDDELKALARQVELGQFPQFFQQGMQDSHDLTHEQILVKLVSAKIEERKELHSAAPYTEIFTTSEQKDLSICIAEIAQNMAEAIKTTETSDKEAARNFLKLIQASSCSHLCQKALEELFSSCHLLDQRFIYDIRFSKTHFKPSQVCWINSQHLAVAVKNYVSIYKFNPLLSGLQEIADVVYEVNYLVGLLCLDEKNLALLNFGPSILKLSINEERGRFVLQEPEEWLKINGLMTAAAIYTSAHKKILAVVSNIFKDQIQHSIIDRYDVATRSKIDTFFKTEPDERIGLLQANDTYIAAAIDRKDKKYSKVRVWEIATGDLVRDIVLSGEEVHLIQLFSGNRIGIAFGEGKAITGWSRGTHTLCIYDIGQSQALLTITCPPLSALNMLDDRYLLLGTGYENNRYDELGGEVRVYDMKTKSVIKTIERLHQAAVIAINVRPTERQDAIIELVYSDGDTKRMPRAVFLDRESPQPYLQLMQNLLTEKVGSSI